MTKGYSEGDQVIFFLSRGVHRGVKKLKGKVLKVGPKRLFLECEEIGRVSCNPENVKKVTNEQASV